MGEKMAENMSEKSATEWHDYAIALEEEVHSLGHVNQNLEQDLKQEQWRSFSSNETRLATDSELKYVQEKHKKEEAARKILESKLQELQAELKSAKHTEETLKNQVEDLTGKLDNFKTSDEAWGSQVNDLKRKVDTIEASAQTWKDKVEELQLQLTSVNDSKEALKSQVKRVRSQVDTSEASAQQWKDKAEGLQCQLKSVNDSKEALKSQVKLVRDEMELLESHKQTLEIQIKELQETVELTKLKLPEGWQRDVVVEKVKSRMTEEMDEEVMQLTKKALSKQSFNTLDDLSTIGKSVLDTINDRHGKYWHSVVGQAGLFRCSIWPDTDSLIFLNIKLASTNKALRVMLFKSQKNEWFYPVGWRNQLRVYIAESKMSDSTDDVKQLVLQAVRRQSTVHTVDDMSNIAEFIKATWEKTHVGCWQAVVGLASSYGGCIRKAPESFIYLNVELTAMKEEMRILLFKAGDGMGSGVELTRALFILG